MSAKIEKTIIIISIDTEASTYNKMPLNLEDMVYGRIGDKYYGIEKIMDICDEYSVKATFFVDVYEFKHFGEQAMKDICLLVKGRGHDVQLHTHPFWAYDRSRGHMALYSLAEQKKIISEGKELIYKWLNEYPIAHRGGDFGVDYNTLIALKENKIPIDSSMLYQWPLCELNTPILTINAASNYDGVVEIPMTVYSYFKYKGHQFTRAFDINANIYAEIKKAVDNALVCNLKIIVLCLHSFSFVKWDKKHINYQPDIKALNRFRKVLKYLASNDNIQILSFKELYKDYQNTPDIINGSNGIPHTGIKYIILRAFYNFNKSWKNRVIVYVILFVGFIGLYLIITKLIEIK